MVCSFYIHVYTILALWIHACSIRLGKSSAACVPCLRFRFETSLSSYSRRRWIFIAVLKHFHCNAAGTLKGDGKVTYEDPYTAGSAVDLFHDKEFMGEPFQNSSPLYERCTHLHIRGAVELRMRAAIAATGQKGRPKPCWGQVLVESISHSYAVKFLSALCAIEPYIIIWASFRLSGIYLGTATTWNLNVFWLRSLSICTMFDWHVSSHERDAWLYI